MVVISTVRVELRVPTQYSVFGPKIKTGTVNDRVGGFPFKTSTKQLQGNENKQNI